MLTGAARGILWHTEWTDWGKGTELWVRYEPQSYKGDDWWEKELSETRYEAEKEKVNEFGRVSGLELVKKPRTTRGVTENAFGYELGFSNEKRPGLGTAVLASLWQANYEFLSRSLAFGIPRTTPKNIDSLTTLDYFRQLQSYGMSAGNLDWFERGLTSGMINASSQAISNNLLTSMAAVKPIAGMLNMQHQRLVFTEGQFKDINPNPLTIQALDYSPWTIARTFKFYLPFPSDIYRARSLTGKSFLRDSDGSK